MTEPIFTNPEHESALRAQVQALFKPDAMAWLFTPEALEPLIGDGESAILEAERIVGNAGEQE